MGEATSHELFHKNLDGCSIQEVTTSTHAVEILWIQVIDTRTPHEQWYCSIGNIGAIVAFLVPCVHSHHVLDVFRYDKGVITPQMEEIKVF